MAVEVVRAPRRSRRPERLRPLRRASNRKWTFDPHWPRRAAGSCQPHGSRLPQSHLLLVPGNRTAARVEGPDIGGRRCCGASARSCQTASRSHASRTDHWWTWPHSGQSSERCSVRPQKALVSQWMPVETALSAFGQRTMTTYGMPRYPARQSHDIGKRYRSASTAMMTVSTRPSTKVSIKATPPRPMAGPRKKAIIRSPHHNGSRINGGVGTNIRLLVCVSPNTRPVAPTIRATASEREVRSV